MSDKVTAPALSAMKSRAEQIVCITAYDFTFAQIADQSGVDVILVGDSVGNVLLGYQTTIPVTLTHMVHHTEAVRKGVTRALLVADLPFGSYQQSTAQALESSVKLMQAGAEAVKLEGDYLEQIVALTKAGIPVLGHIGYTPQSVHVIGGAKMQGRASTGDALVDSAKRICDAGAVAIVLELIPSSVATSITQAVACPTIGIGAGAGCSGQIQVLHDVLGLSERSFRHSMRFAEGHSVFKSALQSYAQAVRSIDGAVPEVTG